MKFKSLIITGIFCCLCSIIIFSQDKQADSLLTILSKAKEDTNKVNTLNELSKLALNKGDHNQARLYAGNALSLSQKINFRKGESIAYQFIGRSFHQTDNYPEALENYYTALKINLEIGERVPIALNYFKIGQAYHNLGNYAQATKNYFASLKVSEEAGYDWGIAFSNNNIGLIYFGQGNYGEALKYYGAALKTAESSGDKKGIAFFNANIGEVYKNQGRYSEALERMFVSVKMLEDIGQKNSIPEGYRIIGNIYEYQGNYAEALKKYFAALGINEEFGNKPGIAKSYICLGAINIKLKKYPGAKKYLSDALAISKNLGQKELTRNTYLNMTALDSATGNWKEAYLHHNFYIIYRDSLINEKVQQEQLRSQMQYEFDKKEDQIELLSAENKLKTILASKEEQRKNFAYGGIAAVFLIGGYGFYRYRRRKKLQSQQTLLNERLRISRELHDEVGATLSGISMYSHLAKEQIKTNQNIEIEKSLTIMQQSSGEMVNKLNDIVWLINPEQDSLQKLIERLEEYARDMAAIKNMQVKITVPDKIAELNLPIENRRNIYLFCKEAINNAVKYSNGSLLELTVKEVDNKLEFSVSDNGKGFDAVMVRRGNGLENMQKRADEIGAKLILQSKLNEGASLSLQCIITQ